MRHTKGATAKVNEQAQRQELGLGDSPRDPQNAIRALFRKGNGHLHGRCQKMQPRASREGIFGINLKDLT